MRCSGSDLGLNPGGSFDEEENHFEILFHIGEKSPTLLPTDSRGRTETIEWLFAALDSAEMASVP